MNLFELRYEIFQRLVYVTDATVLIAPDPGGPLKIHAEADNRRYLITIEEI